MKNKGFRNDYSIRVNIKAKEYDPISREVLSTILHCENVSFIEERISQTGSDMRNRFRMFLPVKLFLLYFVNVKVLFFWKEGAKRLHSVKYDKRAGLISWVIREGKRNYRFTVHESAPLILVASAGVKYINSSMPSLGSYLPTGGPTVVRLIFEARSLADNSLIEETSLVSVYLEEL